MATIYIVNEAGETTPLAQLHSKEEDRELQRLLDKNFDLLPGEQIQPDDPPRWVLIRREMPVPDPNTGQDRWSIDFFFADQHGMPTFVECKRFNNTQARREVVGQMLEYAANGQYYWDKETLRRMAVRTANERGSTLESCLEAIQPDSGESIDEYLELIRNNLAEGQVRLIFFMEEAPFELRSIVEFLNGQMERSEVLIVEARQYRKGDLWVVSPTLFGYTEQARRVKKDVTVTSANRSKWNEADFFEDAEGRSGAEVVESLKRVYGFARDNELFIKWGTGARFGSFSLADARLKGRSLLTAYSNGSLALPFGGMNGSDAIERFRDSLAKRSDEELGFDIPEDYQDRYPQYPYATWGPRLEKLLATVRHLRDVHLDSSLS